MNAAVVASASGAALEARRRLILKKKKICWSQDQILITTSKSIPEIYKILIKILPYELFVKNGKLYHTPYFSFKLFFCSFWCLATLVVSALVVDVFYFEKWWTSVFFIFILSYLVGRYWVEIFPTELDFVEIFQGKILIKIYDEDMNRNLNEDVILQILQENW